MSELTKTIKCVRCHNKRPVPIDWEWKECKPCHDRTNRRLAKGKIPTEKLEAKAIQSLIDFDGAYERYKQFCRNFGREPQTREQFLKEFMQRQGEKISQIKAVIAKYDDRNAPIMNYDCLRFRVLLSQRNAHFDHEEWSVNLSTKDWNLFFNHIPKCESCNTYAVLHKDDVLPVISDFKEDGVSQAGFDQSLDSFWEAMRGSNDPIDDAIHRRYPNLKPCCGTCGTQLVNGQCPRGCRDTSPLSSLTNEYP